MFVFVNLLQQKEHQAAGCARRSLSFYKSSIRWSSVVHEKCLTATAVADSSPPAWGLHFTEQRSVFFSLFLIGMTTFVVAMYVPGAAWSERVNEVSVWQQTES